jgi:hypothetical protein
MHALALALAVISTPGVHYGAHIELSPPVYTVSGYVQWAGGAGAIDLRPGEFGTPVTTYYPDFVPLERTSRVNALRYGQWVTLWYRVDKTTGIRLWRVVSTLP